jgi:hypothetical protein
MPAPNPMPASPDEHLLQLRFSDLKRYGRPDVITLLEGQLGIFNMSLDAPGQLIEMKPPEKLGHLDPGLTGHGPPHEDRLQKWLLPDRLA